MCREAVCFGVHALFLMIICFESDFFLSSSCYCTVVLLLLVLLFVLFCSLVFPVVSVLYFNRIAVIGDPLEKEDAASQGVRPANTEFLL